MSPRPSQRDWAFILLRPPPFSGGHITKPQARPSPTCPLKSPPNAPPKRCDHKPPSLYERPWLCSPDQRSWALRLSDKPAWTTELGCLLCLLATIVKTMWYRLEDRNTGQSSEQIHRNTASQLPRGAARQCKAQDVSSTQGPAADEAEQRAHAEVSLQLPRTTGNTDLSLRATTTECLEGVRGKKCYDLGLYRYLRL